MVSMVFLYINDVHAVFANLDDLNYVIYKFKPGTMVSLSEKLTFF